MKKKPKRRKLLPLGIKNQIQTELPALIALEAVGKPWFCEDHLADLMSLAMVCIVLAEQDGEVHRAALQLFIELGRPELDGVRLRPLVGKASVWLQRQPNGKVDRAIDQLLGAPLTLAQVEAAASASEGR